MVSKQTYVAPLICATYTDSRWETIGFQYLCRVHHSQLTNVRKMYQSWEGGVKFLARSLTCVYAGKRKNYGEQMLFVTAVFRFLLQLLFYTSFSLTDTDELHAEVRACLQLPT
jgi:hypothetical protein